MAAPHRSDPHLRLSHSILEQMMVSDFTKTQLSVLLFILRLSWGCDKDFATIKKRSFFEIVGIGHSHIGNILRVLIRDKVIIIEGDRYSFNKDFDQWKVSRATAYDQNKLNDLVRFNIERFLPQSMRLVIEPEPPTPEATVKEEPAPQTFTPTIEDMDILSVWQGVNGFKMDDGVLFELLVKVKDEFTDLDILAESKAWAARKLSEPLEKKSKPSGQI